MKDASSQASPGQRNMCNGSKFNTHQVTIFQKICQNSNNIANDIVNVSHDD